MSSSSLVLATGATIPTLGEVFVTSKLPAEIKGHRQVQASFDQTMRQLALDYVDLYLIHAPWPWSEIGKDCTAQNKQVWARLDCGFRAALVPCLRTSAA